MPGQLAPSNVVRLVREVRFAADAGLLASDSAVLNGFAGWPSTRQLVPHLTLRLAVDGAIDPATGMLVNIVEVDRRARESILPAIVDVVSHRGVLEAALLAGWRALRGSMLEANTPRPVAVALFASPLLSAACAVATSPAPDSELDMPTIYLTEAFEFAASHRLHSRQLDDETNRRVFGKCNNPAGHGHNYVVEVTLRGQPDQHGHLLAHEAFELAVKKRVIDVMDHRHLSEEVEPFSGGVNSTVEQIALECLRRLDGAFGLAEVHRVRVWETPKTYAEVFARGPMAVDSVM